MKINSDHIAPCGLWLILWVFAVLYATRDNNVKFKERLVGVYRSTLPGCDDLSTEDIYCEGCLSQRPFIYCNDCPIRGCTEARGYAGCHECGDFPCQLIEDFPIPVGKKVILRAIPHWQEAGTEKFIRDEEGVIGVLSVAASSSGARRGAINVRHRCTWISGAGGTIQGDRCHGGN